MGIYIHVPFCLRKCPYCGFYSKAVGRPAEGNFAEEEGDFAGEKWLLDRSTEDEIAVYIERVIGEISRLSSKYASGRIVDSIFFGGGTPTVLKSEEIIAILDAVRRNFSLSFDCEISIETNPGIGNLGEPYEVKLARLNEAGFNRLSIGIQSFDHEVLGYLGRIHSSQEAEEAFRLGRNAGFHNINLDLMFGIPGQTLKVWKETLDKAISLKPEHISFYSLQIEEGTPYYERFMAGTMNELPDETDREMYHLAIGELKKAGYKHYEISNAAFPGFECRHNLKYWTLKEYLSFGPAASSYIDGARFTWPSECFINEDNSGDYINGKLEGMPDYHINSRFDDMSEFVFTGLRLTGGINYGEFQSRFGEDIHEAFGDRWHELKPFFESGALVEYRDAEGNLVSMKLSEKGIDVSNKIMAVFV